MKGKDLIRYIQENKMQNVDIDLITIEDLRNMKNYGKKVAIYKDGELVVKGKLISECDMYYTVKVARAITANCYLKTRHEMKYLAKQ